MKPARLLRFKWLKLMRISDSNRRIAGGLALGMAISFSPLIGLHMLMALGLSYALRFNVLAALTGTLLGNPWTLPFIWYVSVALGSFIFDLLGFSTSVQLPETVTLAILWDIIKTEPLRLFLPWFVGGHILTFSSYPIFYYVSLHFIRTARRARRKALMLKRRKRIEVKK